MVYVLDFGFGYWKRCENCHHFDTLIDWNEGIYYKCMMGNPLWKKCNDFDKII